MRPRRLLCSTLLVLSALSTACSGQAEGPAPAGIRLSSVGYPLEVAKHATVSTMPGMGDTFRVVELASGETVHEGDLTGPAPSPETQETVRQAAFTSLPAGRYRLEVEGLPPSAPFTVGADVLNERLRLVMLGFYGQRCGMAVEFEHEGHTFAHAACHLDDGYLDEYDPARAGERKDGVGGWHDAGDYGKYAVNAGFTNGMMLAAWEQYGDRLQHLALPIPEAGGDLPDYLDELRYNVAWLLKLQFPDGRVSHKLTRHDFAPFIMPSADDGKRYYAPWGTAANANFCASMLMASRVFEPYDEDFAERCKEAAVRAWEAMQPAWREVRPDLSAFNTGAYLTPSESDVLWASVEMLLTAPEALSADERAGIERRLTQDNFAFDVDWDWGRPGNLGLYSYLFSEAAEVDPEIRAHLAEDLLLAADRLLETHDAHAYGRSLRGYYWGVNGSVARSTMTLQAAYRLSGDERYRHAAFNQLAYLYGRNPYSRSFVTGDGLNPPNAPHHRPSGADDLAPAWPGHLVGGPHPTELDWVDEESSYALNENAINWDGALAYALAAFYVPGEDE
ncbi:MAG: glycoside hydrolase family 9 protein [Opitutales bacterium]